MTEAEADAMVAGRERAASRIQEQLRAAESALAQARAVQRAVRLEADAGLPRVWMPYPYGNANCTRPTLIVGETGVSGG